MNFFPPVHTWNVSANLLSLSLEEMALDGCKGNEGICLWLGTRGDDGIATVSHAVRLRGMGISKSPANIQITPELLRDVHHFARTCGVILLGQIHSHGPYHSLDLSPTDLRYGISVPYYLSLVAPDYGLNEATEYSDCSINVFMPGEGYQRLSADEAASAVRVSASLPLKEATIGEL
jgi:hypothetical protein